MTDDDQARPESLAGYLAVLPDGSLMEDAFGLAILFPGRDEAAAWGKARPVVHLTKGEG